MNIIEKTYTLNGDLKTRSKTNRIILHHAAATNCTVEDIDRWHKGNGWTCIGYHFFVNKKGEVYRGRKENTVGAHAGNNNSDSIGICAEGNFENETMGTAQKEALKELVAYLKNKYGISKVQKHKDVNATACPGKNYPFDEIAKATIKEETKDTLYKVQVGAFSKKENANNYAKELEAKGYDTYIVYIDNLYKVQLGAFSKESNAINLMNELKAKGIDAFVTTGEAVKVENKKSVDEIAKEVIAGKWGNGEERKTKLTKAGHDYDKVQKRVNQLLK